MNSETTITKENLKEEKEDIQIIQILKNKTFMRYS